MGPRENRSLLLAVVFAVTLGLIVADFTTWIELDIAAIFGLPLVLAGAARSRALLWTLTGLLAAGAATTGVIAYRSKQELDSQLEKFPLDHNEVDFYNRRTRGFALATDGLLIGTSVMAAIALYLTLRDPD